MKEIYKKMQENGQEPPSHPGAFAVIALSGMPSPALDKAGSFLSPRPQWGVIFSEQPSRNIPPGTLLHDLVLFSAKHSSLSNISLFNVLLCLFIACFCIVDWVVWELEPSQCSQPLKESYSRSQQRINQQRTSHEGELGRSFQPVLKPEVLMWNSLSHMKR